MRDVVVIPCYERPEFTRLALQYLSRARGIEDKQVWMRPDHHVGDDKNIIKQLVKVADYALEHFPSFYFGHRTAHDTYGNSENLLESLQCAYDSGAERVYLLEDDIAVAPDFFSWHDAVLEEPNVFVSCATALSKSAHFQINGPQAMDETYQDPSAYFLAEGPYSSHAAAFKRRNLGLLLSRLNNQKREWRSGYEQDLLTQQFLRATKQRSAWPYVPRAYNFGWYSYHINTGRKFTGDLESKVRAVEAAISDPGILREVSANNSAVTPLPEKWPARLELVKNVQRFR
jgi:hypothetical protein